jgi:hypothetical protein
MNNYQYTTIEIPNEKETTPHPDPIYQYIQPSPIYQQQPIYIIQSFIQYVIIPVFIPVPVYNNYF